MRSIIGIPAVAALVYRAWARKTLTQLGLVIAAISATAHVVHPWSTPFALLAVFYFAGTKVTKVPQRPAELHRPWIHTHMDEADADLLLTTGQT